MRAPRSNLFLLGAALAAWCRTGGALAQTAPRPFAVGGGEGGGSSGGVTGWLLAEQSQLTHLISAQLRALHNGPAALWGLMGLGLLYGVFHAAGPGHGKALIASYMLANERSLQRGAVLALLAALLQAMVAVALVGAAALIFNATSSQMNRAADLLELASYCGIAVIGAWLTWRKSGAFIRALATFVERRRGLALSPSLSGVDWRAPAPAMPSASFRAVAPGAPGETADECGHAHAPDPSRLGDRFSWRDAAGTVVAAGVRPCSGAILILVFSLSQGLLAAGVAATLAMALGTAVTTGALATLAVFAKETAVRLAAGEDSRVMLLARLFELAAALGVLAFGVALLFSARGGA